MRNAFLLSTTSDSQCMWTHKTIEKLTAVAILEGMNESIPENRWVFSQFSLWS